MTPPTTTDAGPRGWHALPERHPRAVLGAAALLVVLSVALIGTMRTDGSLAAMLPTHDASSAALARVAGGFDASRDATLLVTLPGDGPGNQADLTGFAERFAAAMERHEAAGGPACRVKSTWPDDAERWVKEEVTPDLALYLDEAGQAALAGRLSPAGMAEQMRMNERVAAAPGVAGGAIAPLLEDPLRLRELVGGVFEDLADASTGGGRPGEPMVSADGRSLLVRVTPTHPRHDSAEARGVMSAVRASIDAAGPGPLRVEVAGGLAIAETAERTIRADMILSSIGTVVLLQLLFLATYRRLLLFPIAFLPAAVGVLAGFGVFALTGRAVSPPTAVIGALLAGLGIDYAIHYLAHAGDGHAPRATSRRLAAPLAMACVTSVIAFLAIGLSGVAALRDFATIGAVGLAATLAATLTLLPALLTLIHRKKQGKPGSADTGTPDPAAPRWRLDAPLHAAVRHGKAGIALTAAAVLVAGVLLVALPGGPARFDAGLDNMHPQPNAPLDAQRRVAEAFPGRGDVLLLYLTADSEQALVERAHQSRERLAGDAAASRHVSAVFGIDRLLPTAEEREQRRAFVDRLGRGRVLADYDAAVDASIFSPAALAGYRDYLGRLLAPGDGPSLQTLRGYPGLASGLLPAPQARGNGGGGDAASGGPRFEAVSLVFLDEPLDDRARRAEAVGALRAAVGDIPGVTLTGVTVVAHDVESAVKGDLSRLLGVAAAAVALWLGLCFRSLRDTALALVPVTAGLVLLFAIMLVSGVGLNLLNLVALPLLAGLGVDDGVFMVAIARDARRGGLDRAGLLRELANSAQAVTMTSATTALAFGSLVLTGVPAIRSLGVVMAVGIAACLLVTLVALAPLLVMLYPNDDPSADTDSTTPQGIGA